MALVLHLSELGSSSLQPAHTPGGASHSKRGCLGHAQSGQNEGLTDRYGALGPPEQGRLKNGIELAPIGEWFLYQKLVAEACESTPSIYPVPV